MPSPLITRRRLIGSSLALSLIDLPARAEPAAGGFFELQAAPGRLQLLPQPAAETPVFAFNGAVPGPLLRCKKGEELKLRLVNKLEQPMSLMWPGLRIANAMDGVGGLTQKPVEPGESFDYRFTPPDSGLFAYRPGYLPFAAEQFSRGLYGALIVEETDPPRVDRDMLAIIADWRLDDQGMIAEDFGAKEEALGPGSIGALVTVNSQPTPLTETTKPGARVRLRLVSATAARIMSIAFEGVTPMILAVDGQPADSAFEPVRRTIPVGPGARFDVMFDLPAEAGKEARLVLRGDNEPDRDLLMFKTEAAAETAQAAAAPAPIASLPVNPLLPTRIRLETAKRLDIVIEPAKPAPTTAGGRELVWSLNGGAVADFAEKPLFSVKRGAAVSLGLVNRSNLTQAIHIRGHQARLLHDLDDGWEPYWRDNILIGPGKTKRIAFIAETPGKWAILSFIAGREGAGLAAWFLVT
ncbi:multicopper oxidase type 3 [Methylocella silvestris BL2]|uniref:Multicopper oxidase type 3 n=1 Tax=Methylocella silvestris (strain DSM 15510 / CIP 108128 / LMG 27833 / NCIMB 13906 / BL2) TaxID=395965 RepID=B8EIL0_METSB|nr:multicopper oxidase family protein [Methylocella silvestris]ACK51827.1 multicopper oxidase type 3 [Methylocella silvestris BL2]